MADLLQLSRGRDRAVTPKPSPEIKNIRDGTIATDNFRLQPQDCLLTKPKPTNAGRTKLKGTVSACGPFLTSIILAGRIDKSSSPDSGLSGRVPGVLQPQAEPPRLLPQKQNTGSSPARYIGPKEVAVNRSEGTCTGPSRSGLTRVAEEPRCRLIIQLVLRSIQQIMAFTRAKPTVMRKSLRTLGRHFNGRK